MSSFNSELGAFLVGIIGNLVASYIYDSLNSKNNQKPPIVMNFQATNQANYINQRSSYQNLSNGTRNHELLKRGVYQILFFCITFFIFWATVQITIGLLGNSNPHKMSLLVRNTFLAYVLYIPLVYICDYFITNIKQKIPIVGLLTFEGWLIARAVTFLFLSLLLGGIVSFLLGVSLSRSFGIPIFLFVVIILTFFFRDSETKRPRNICWECSNTWFPRGKKLSKQCPNCKSRSVSVDWIFEYREQICSIGLFAIVFILALYAG